MSSEPFPDNLARFAEITLGRGIFFVSPKKRNNAPRSPTVMRNEPLPSRLDREKQKTKKNTTSTGVWKGNHCTKNNSSRRTHCLRTKGTAGGGGPSQIQSHPAEACRLMDYQYVAQCATRRRDRGRVIISIVFTKQSPVGSMALQTRAEGKCVSRMDFAISSRPSVRRRPLTIFQWGGGQKCMRWRNGCGV